MYQKGELTKMADSLTVSQAKQESKRLNTLNMQLVRSLEESFELQGKVFTNIVLEEDIPQDNMTYFIIETGDYLNTIAEKRTVSETVTITFWNENRSDPVLDQLMIIALAMDCKLKIVSSNNQQIILDKTNRVINMFTLTTSRGVKVGC